MSTIKRGFTLIETMVAVAIITVAIIGPLYALQQGLENSYGARDKLIASGLAQEGVEFIHGVRDGNYLYNIVNKAAPRSWFHGLDGNGTSIDCTGGNTCVIDAYYNTVALCTGACPPLKILSTGLYNQGAVSASNVATRFTRTVQLNRINGREMQVLVTVSWMSSQTQKSVVVSENIQDWL